MSRSLHFAEFLLRDFSRTLWVVVPPGLTLAFYRLFFQYGSDADYLASVGAIMFVLICLATTLLIASRTDRASTYPLLARLGSRSAVVLAVGLASLLVTVALAICFLTVIILNRQVPLTPSGLADISVRWLTLFVFTIAFGLHMSRLISRGGSNLLAYLLLISLVVSYQRLEYPPGRVLDTAALFIGYLKSPVEAVVLGGVGMPPLQALAFTLGYALVLLLLAILLFARKDLLWAE